ncbi:MULTISPECIES: AfsR/SARP family transcriptional regulator [unclassified Crossiella]|uniref:AfsR/SARP family transcriptional regulator n=1 Tax=unclassified Crossiella TaxID=2620835 RepID=UPI001FFE5E42|nr:MULTISPECIES: AfsR/SARP family transcriptional regulator [unclassified Crossiella]MCK2244323.1 AfsR/SARP family transcriptional regulator [Crossiella sp. S99.2]MCK2257849.1 AfsR/SARP family transcriptional regulator [Crossiella sp. S99.1]
MTLNTNMRFRLAGRVEVVTGELVVPIASATVRGLFSALLLEAGSYVTRERLIESLWDDPPKSAGENLRGYVWRLRQQLTVAAEGLADRLATLVGHSGGYAMLVPPHQVDVFQFSELAARGSAQLRAGALAEAAASFGHALKLWQGPVGQGCAASRTMQARFRSLEQLQLTVRERLAHVRLVEGRSAELIPDLQTMVGAAPYREVSWALLMRASYLAGDIAGAMATWQAATSTLAEKFGLDPSEEFRNLHLSVLQRDENRVRNGVLRL